MNSRNLRVTCPAPRAVWHALVEKDPLALVTQTPAWVDTLCAMGGYQDVSRLYELPDARQLVLPAVQRTLLPKALATEASFPNGWGMGGFVAESEIRVEDVAWVLDDLATQTALQITIRPNPLTAELWAAVADTSQKLVKIPRIAHVLDLTGGFEETWDKRFSGKVRTAVRKAEKSRLEVECDTTGKFVPIFYTLWQESVERWARQQHEPLWLARLRGQYRDPIRKFHLMAKHLGKACQIWVARLDGQPVASIIVLQGAHNAHYTRGVMNKELANPVRANDLLHKLAIEDACRAGCHHYHMGETGESELLARFKKSFGAEAYHYTEYRLEHIPLSRANYLLRGSIKRLIGFRDT